MTLEVYEGNSGLPIGKADVGGGNVKVDGALYQYMGSVATYQALLALDTTDFKPGYVYDVQEDGMDYAWTGTEWNALGTHTDLSNYYTKDQTYSKSEVNNLTSNMVTTDTAQTITGDKLFSQGLKIQGDVGIKDNNNVSFIKTDPSLDGEGGYNWLIGSTGSREGDFHDIYVKTTRGVNVNIDSGNIATNTTITGLTSRVSSLETTINGGSANA